MWFGFMVTLPLVVSDPAAVTVNEPDEAVATVKLASTAVPLVKSR